MIIEKPLKISNCQLKIIRENSLIVKGFKEIHTRASQSLNGRKVYKIDKLTNNISIEKNIPKEFSAMEKKLFGNSQSLLKLSTINGLKAAKKLTKGLKRGIIKNFSQKGLKLVRNGVALKDALLSNEETFNC